MHNLHQYSYQNIGDELIWPASMPCIINGEESIPIAQFGYSNLGQLKHAYRHGLWHRYGRTMQAIAGSLSDQDIADISAYFADFK